MSFQEAAQRAVNSMFSKLGKPAVYTPDGAAAMDVIVIPRQPDEIMDVMETRVHTETSIFEIRLSEIPHPKENDLIMIDSKTFTVKGEPLKEQHGLVWKLTAYPQSE